MLCPAESEGGSGDLVVDFKDAANPAKIRLAVSAGCDEPLAHAAQEPALVDPIVDLSEPPGAGSQINRRGDGANAGDEPSRVLAQFACQLQHDIAAQRETNQVHRRAPLLLELLQHGQQVRGEPAVIQRGT